MQYHPQHDNAFYLEPEETRRFFAKNGRSVVLIASMVGMHEATLDRKLHGVYPFTLIQFARVCQAAHITPRDVLVQDNGRVSSNGYRLLSGNSTLHLDKHNDSA